MLLPYIAKYILLRISMDNTSTDQPLKKKYLRMDL